MLDRLYTRFDNLSHYHQVFKEICLLPANIYADTHQTIETKSAGTGEAQEMQLQSGRHRNDRGWERQKQRGKQFRGLGMCVHARKRGGVERKREGEGGRQTDRQTDRQTHAQTEREEEREGEREGERERERVQVETIGDAWMGVTNLVEDQVLTVCAVLVPHNFTPAYALQLHS